MLPWTPWKLVPGTNHAAGASGRARIARLSSEAAGQSFWREGTKARRHEAIRSATFRAIKEWAGAVAPYIAFFTALWAIFIYRRAKKVEVARLQKQIFDDLYLGGKFNAIREALDWDYAKKIGPVLRTFRTEPGQVSQTDRATLTELDNFLNLIEYVLYLEQDKKLLTAADRKALLAYWMQVVGDQPELRTYVSDYNYERLAACLSAEKA